MKLIEKITACEFTVEGECVRPDLVTPGQPIRCSLCEIAHAAVKKKVIKKYRGSGQVAVVATDDDTEIWILTSERRVAPDYVANGEMRQSAGGTPFSEAELDNLFPTPPEEVEK